MLPTRYWISARTLKKPASLPLVKKLKVLAPPVQQEEQKEVIPQFVLTEDGTPIILYTELPREKK